MKKTKDLLFFLPAAFLLLSLFNLPSLHAQPLSKCPRHYMLTRSMAAMNKVKDNPDFEGYQVIVEWKSIEPAKDSFDFQLIDSFLHYAGSHGKKLFIQFQYKSFRINEVSVPDYLLGDSIYEGGVQRYANGSSLAKIWIPAVQERLDTVFRAMARHFGHDPALRGLNLPETASGTPLAYDIKDYMSGIRANLLHLRNAFPDSVIVIQYLNWLPGTGAYLLDSLRALADFSAGLVNCGFGGPDNKIQISPNPAFTWVMTFQHEYDGRALLANATQWNDYGYINPYTLKRVTAEDILRYSVDTLKDDYIFWLDREPYFSDDVIPALRAYRNNCLYTSIEQIPFINPCKIRIAVLPEAGGINITGLGNCANSCRIRVVDIRGKVRLSAHTDSDVFMIKDLAFPSGMYICLIEDLSGHILARRKFILTGKGSYYR